MFINNSSKSILNFLQTPTIVDQWIVDLMNSKKSVLIQINNSTDYTLKLESHNLFHGIYRQFPPDIIEPGTSKNFGAENHGLNGTEGDVKYSISIKKGDSTHTCILQASWKGIIFSKYYLMGYH